jgi:hypothetical protein
MEERAELSASSWLVAHGNTHEDEPKTRPLYSGEIQAPDTSDILHAKHFPDRYTDQRHPFWLRSFRLCLYLSQALFTWLSTH